MNGAGPLTDILEDLDTFRDRVGTWMSENLPRRDLANPWDPIEGDDDRASMNRELQKKLYAAGFAGLCYPKEYGGQGLTIEYQRTLDAVSVDYDMPLLFSVPTLSICGPTILEFGTEEQKQRYIRGFISGEELWVQFMSEPSGGSDMAGALTRADRDGDVYLVNGSKVWSTYAYRSDFALCLVRTNWDLPKHRGLSMLIMPIHHPGVEVTQIEMVDGSMEFCQEYFDDAVIPVENVLGEPEDGWTVASRLLFHERGAVGGTSQYTAGRYRGGGDTGRNELALLAKESGRADEPRTRQMLGQTEVLNVVQRQLIDRVRNGLTSGYFPAPSGSMVRLFGGMASVERINIGKELKGEQALVWDPDGDDGAEGLLYLRRQGSCLGGGSTEMARNIISERILGMPREYAADRDVPFTDVQRNPGR
jgi:alkylation response protein AidB-like acyl-CoA dehydrogenase